MVYTIKYVSFFGDIRMLLKKKTKNSIGYVIKQVLEKLWYINARDVIIFRNFAESAVAALCLYFFWSINLSFQTLHNIIYAICILIPTNIYYILI